MPASKYCIACLILLLFSCSVGQLTISVLEPARYRVDPDIKRVTLFPGAGIPDPPGVIDSIHLIGLDPGYNYNRLKRGYMEGIFGTMSSSPRFSKVVLADTLFEEWLHAGLISWDELRQICNHDTTDAVVILKKAFSLDKIYRYKTPDLTCNILYQVANHTWWTFFQPFVQKEYESIFFADSSIFEQEEDCYVPGTLQDIPGILYEAFYQTGSRLGAEISPTWNDNVRRFFYLAPGKEMRYAARLVVNNEWKEAADIWNVLTNDRKKRLASHASYNMALAWEQEDDLDQALLWINYADSLASSGKTLVYKKIIEDRIKSKALLDQQMHGD